MRGRISPACRPPGAPARRRLKADLRRHVSRFLPYAPDQLFALVGDVAAYPDFVPWITAMRTWNAQILGEGVDTVDAEAAVGFSFLNERFSTRVRRDAAGREIRVSLLSGPFRRLENSWRFCEAEGPDGRPGTRVEFDIDFQFKSRLLDGLLKANDRHAVDRLMSCFEARAKALYG